MTGKRKGSVMEIVRIDQLFQNSKKPKNTNSKENSGNPENISNEIEQKIRGQIRVGTRKGDHDPSFEGFIPIVCLTKSTAYGALGPYALKDENGELIENAWQKSKVLKNIPKSVQRRSRFDPTIIWNYKAFQGVDSQGNLTPDWFEWSAKLGKANDPVRYPLTYDPKIRAQTLGCYSVSHCARPHIDCLLDIPNARKKIYFAKYIPAAKKDPLYNRLNKMLDQGKNLLLIDIDGAREESLDYYKRKYGVGDDFIQNDTILITRQNLEIMLNDPKHSVGHCFGLSGALLGMEDIFI